MKSEMPETRQRSASAQAPVGLASILNGVTAQEEMCRQTIAASQTLIAAPFAEFHSPQMWT
jgi:hypothetical protein